MTTARPGGSSLYAPRSKSRSGAPFPGGAPEERSSLAPSDRVPVYILAGGQSRRFGTDKALSDSGGRPLIVGVAEALAPVAERVKVVAHEAGSYADLALDTIGDMVRNKGPIGGVLTAVDDAGDGRWIFVTACDWVGIRTEWARLILDRRRPTVQAVVFHTEHFEPLFGAYHTSIGDVVRRRIDADRLAMHELLLEIETLALPAPPGWGEVVNLNRPPSA